MDIPVGAPFKDFFGEGNQPWGVQGSKDHEPTFVRLKQTTNKWYTSGLGIISARILGLFESKKTDTQNLLVLYGSLGPLRQKFDSL